MTLKDWTRALVAPEADVRTAMEVLNRAGLQIALVADDERRLVGVVTDGDVRRALLRGVSLTCSVSRVMQASPITAPVGAPQSRIVALFRRRRIQQCPIVDEQGVVQGVYCIDDLLGTRQAGADCSVVIMAGGLGSRLGPLTKSLPKPMLKVGDRPILQTILENLVTQGFQRFVFALNYKAQVIKDHFGDGGRWNADIRYVVEEKRLGTAGALSLLPDKPSTPTLVMNGDVLTRLDLNRLIEFHQQHAAVATMVVREHESQVAFGVVECEGHQITRLSEKPREVHLVNAGIYCLSPAAIERVPADRGYDMTDLFEHLLVDGAQPLCFPLTDYWLDVGRRPDLDRAKEEFDDTFGS